MRLFGTDGVRGVANGELTPELALRVAEAAATVLARGGKRLQVLVGRDTRWSGGMLEAAVTAGLCAAGAHVVKVGVVTTPGVAYLVRALGFDAGVVISASHNPSEYNGIKFFDGSGKKLPQEVEREIEGIALCQGSGRQRPCGSGIGLVVADDAVARRYWEFLRGAVPVDLTGVKMVVDCANGACSRYAPSLFSSLGAEVVATSDRPDGLNINHRCGSTHPEVVAQRVIEHGAHVGLSFDGDGDRVILADEKGNLLDGDCLLGVMAWAWREEGKLSADAVVGTVMSNLGLEIFLRGMGVTLVRSAVGDRYVLEEMERRGCPLGGEQSGHVILRPLMPTGDGMLTGLEVLRIWRQRGRPISELGRMVPRLPQVLVNVPVNRKDAWQQSDRIMAMLEEVRRKLGDEGRVLVRASGTEPVVRVMVEGPDREEVARLARELARVVGEELA